MTFLLPLICKLLVVLLLVVLRMLLVVLAALLRPMTALSCFRVELVVGVGDPIRLPLSDISCYLVRVCMIPNRRATSKAGKSQGRLLCCLDVDRDDGPEADLLAMHALSCFQ